MTLLLTRVGNSTVASVDLENNRGGRRALEQYHEVKSYISAVLGSVPRGTAYERRYCASRSCQCPRQAARSVLNGLTNQQRRAYVPAKERPMNRRPRLVLLSFPFQPVVWEDSTTSINTAKGIRTPRESVIEGNRRHDFALGNRADESATHGQAHGEPLP